MEISEVGRILKIGEFSDVAFMKKFGKCADWFRWISEQLAHKIVTDYSKPQYLEDYRVIALDASDVVEKGRSGQTFRLHYGLDIFKMTSVFYKITKQEVGETLRNFELSEGDLVIADRAYGTMNGIEHCLESKADFILRVRSNCFSLYDEQGGKIDVLSSLGGLDYGQSTGFQAFIRRPGGLPIPVRICAKRKSESACNDTHKRLNRMASKRQMEISEGARRLNEFIVVVSSLPDNISNEDVLETYRYRWQVECYFKRLKSILDFGELPKKRDSSSLSWLNGKMMVALLIEILMGSNFSPLECTEESDAEYLEGNQDAQSHHSDEYNFISPFNERDGACLLQHASRKTATGDSIAVGA
ncbi:MAG: transposase [Synergistaceae bacterium]|nr:transposase [Synergistaceae bacterium]